MAYKKNKQKPKMYRGKRKKYSAAEKRAYLIGLGRGARVITGSGQEVESFNRGLNKNAKIELSKY